MSDDDDDSSDFERRAKRVFDDSVAALDAATRSRLTQARYRALEERSRRATAAGARRSCRRERWPRRRSSRGSSCGSQPPATDAVQAAPLGDLEILLGEEDLEMLDEEIEFYGWLEEQPEFANGRQRRLMRSASVPRCWRSAAAGSRARTRAGSRAGAPEPRARISTFSSTSALGPKRTTSGSRSRNGRRTTG